MANTEIKIPCIGCVCLSICKSNIGVLTDILYLENKCKILHDFIVNTKPKQSSNSYNFHYNHKNLQIIFWFYGIGKHE